MIHAHRWVALATLLLVLSLFLVLGPVRQEDAQALHLAEEQQLLALINEYRQANGVVPLVPSETLSTAATRHSEDMATYGFYDHTTQASSYYPVGSEYYDRMAQEGYPTEMAYLAENLGMGSTAQEVYDMWHSSDLHNAHMLDGNYTAVGIGRVGSYWTADFGSTAAP